MNPFDLFFKKKKKRHPLLGRRQGEQGWLEDGARLLKEVISSSDGRGCYPIRMFSAKEIEQAIQQLYHKEEFYDEYEGTHEDRQIIIKPILIYEYVPFILSYRLHEPNPSSSSISWEHRLRIAIEIAYAITYLHIGTSRPIVHGGIKSSNVLLDEHNKPKLADFSLSVTIPFGETHVETFVAGTLSYLAPEYALRGIVSEKTDVYSYAVLLLVLLSGKRPYVSNLTIDMDEGLLHKFFDKESTEEEERLELILHNGLSMDVRQVEQAMACIKVAVGCRSSNPVERPAMKEVAQQLERIERGDLPLSSSLLRAQQLGKYKVE